MIYIEYYWFLMSNYRVSIYILQRISFCFTYQRYLLCLGESGKFLLSHRIKHINVSINALDLNFYLPNKVFNDIWSCVYQTLRELALECLQFQVNFFFSKLRLAVCVNIRHKLNRLSQLLYFPLVDLFLDIYPNIFMVSCILASN